MILKWTKKYKDKWGYTSAKELYIKDTECLKKPCFRLHDWNHDGHLVCIINANFGCPEKECK
jgi:hypothetical protein